MITKKCHACWKDIPFQASKCPYCQTEQRRHETTKEDMKVWTIICLLISFAFFLGSVFTFVNPSKTQRANPEWRGWYADFEYNEVPEYIYENDYTLPICLAIGGGIFLIVTGIMFWEVKND